jgi:hypothetical protein
MLKYDPEQTPNPADWLALGELERIDLVHQFHEVARIKMPNAKGHAVFHAIIENQIAESMEPIVRAMSRLQREGLSRHDAVHAVASVMAEYLHEVMTAENGSAIPNESYFAAVERLSAKGWLTG